MTKNDFIKNIVFLKKKLKINYKYIFFRVENLLEASKKYVWSLHCPDDSFGAFKYKDGDNPPLLYASVFAALHLSLVNELACLDKSKKEEWASYINSFQDIDGLFKDPLIMNEIAEKEDWWGWRHLTILALMALNALDSKPRFSLNFLENINNIEKCKKWLDSLNWHEKIAFTSNTVQNYITAMQFARDKMGEENLKNITDFVLTELFNRCDPSSGLWLSGITDKRNALSQEVQAGYHFWLLFFYDEKMIPYPPKLYKNLQELQNPIGGFNLADFNASACEDIDAIDPLVRLANFPTVNRKEISTIITKSLKWLVFNYNPDGGAVFRRDSSFEYGHPLMKTEKNQSSIFATWFRTLSLALCIEYLRKETSIYDGIEFNYLNCPGLQFFKRKTF